MGLKVVSRIFKMGFGVNILTINTPSKRFAKYSKSYWQDFNPLD